MPRRKQDRPQHFEEDMKMEQLINGAVRDCVQSMQSDIQVVCQKDLREPLMNNIIDCNGVEESVEDLTVLEAKDLVNGDEDVRPAVIGNQEWLDVQSTLTSIQSQMRILQLQQFQLMKLLASQNQNSNAHSSTNCDSLSTVPSSEGNQDQVDKSSSPNPCKPTAQEDEQDLKQYKETEVYELEAVDEDDKSLDTGAGEIENTFDLGLHCPGENDDLGEPASFDCTRCSAVLPSPELLKIHMFSHERRETNLDHCSPSDTVVDLSSNVQSAAPGSSSLNSLPPSYQSIINDLSNDSLEEYMEIQKPENTHLEHLVKNMDGTVTDPNQCLICKRILSCKSALMMHYRTHTGERPFKCKLCSRAFTTKGNLKTHMGVHRAKPPLRLLHNCMICNKQFTNALVLNQHMKLHSEESSRKRNFDVPSSISGEECKKQRLSLNSDSSYKEETVENSFDLVKRSIAAPDYHHLPSLATSSAPGFPFDIGGIPSIHDPLRYAELFARQWEQFSQYPVFNPMAPLKSPVFSGPFGLQGPSGLGLPFPVGGNFGTHPRHVGKVNFPNANRPEECPQPAEKPKQQDADLEDKSSDLSPQHDKAHLDARLSNVSPKSERSWGSMEAASSTASGLRLDPPPGTTCDICLKTFACRSALEIHYRSHTKHRPFKCDLCDKAFTTRGNMKQHILTHKSEDLQWNNGDKQMIQQTVPSPPNSSELSQSNEELKKSGGRHQCSICLKYFSSASAVQIHFRTHTGDRPFKCSVCGKAFTTKGNLKVHMGTHMWNGSSPITSIKPDIGDNCEMRVDTQDEEATPAISPTRPPIMNNNNLGWNHFNPSPLMKSPFLGNHSAVLANYHNMFGPPPALPPPPTEEHQRPWAWQFTCHICNKELPSPASLELHMKMHIVNESTASKPVPAS